MPGSAITLQAPAGAAAGPLAPVPAEVVVGMPQMNSLGLSENWLLKEAGDRHWRHLAARLGCRPGELRDAAGRRVYAAFTQVHLRDARLPLAREDQRLQFQLRGAPVGRSQHYSQMALVGPEGGLARLELLSVFVVRERAGDNHSVVRVPMAEGGGAGDAALAEEAAACAEAARAVRGGAWNERFGAGPEAQALAVQAVRPCPYGDFNGAGLLYFASFQALADRAHWDWGLADGRASVRERQVVFHGNLNVGETLELRLLAHRPAGRGHWSWTQVRRAGDGKVLADMAVHWG